MAFKISEGQIFLHKNQNAQHKQPVIKGSCMIMGIEYEIALWGSKSGKDGSYSGKISIPKTKSSDFLNGAPKKVEPAKNSALDDLLNDAIPF